MGQLFLSHCGEDGEQARELARGLKNCGRAVWCSSVEGTIPSGSRWVDAIYTALEACDAYAILVGAGRLDGWVAPEIDFALNQRAARESNFPIVPILLPGREPAELPACLTGFQTLRLDKLPARCGPEDFLRLADQLRQQRALSESETDVPEGGPFPGLEAFDESRARFFFGRGDEVRHLCTLLGTTDNGYRRWLHVHGGSGSGKSSLVRAGLIPVVRRGLLGRMRADGTRDVPEGWVVAVMRPGRDPLSELIRAVTQALDARAGDRHARAGDHDAAIRADESRSRTDAECRKLVAEAEAAQNAGRDSAARKAFDLWLDGAARDPRLGGRGLLLVIDQLEESFTHGGELALFDRLLAEALQRDNRLFLVTTMRSDFLHRMDREDGLPELSALEHTHASTYPVKRIRKHALGALIRGPVRLAGLTLEAGLDGRLIEEVGEAVRAPEGAEKIATDQPALPLLAHALATLWRNRDPGSRMLSFEKLGQLHGQHGGVRGLISASADELIGSLSPADQVRALNLLMALVRTGRGEADTRKTLPIADARGELGDPDPDALLARLSGGRDPAAGLSGRADVRLITVDQDGDQDPGRVDLVHEALLRCWKRLRDRVNAERPLLELRDALDDHAQAWDGGGRDPGGLPEGGQLELYGRLKSPKPLSAEFLAAARAKAEHRKMLTRVTWIILSTVTAAALVFAYVADSVVRKNTVFDDDVKLTGLTQRAALLWPYGPPDGQAFAQWLTGADDILSRADRHRKDLKLRTERAAKAASLPGVEPAIESEDVALQSLVDNLDGGERPFVGLRDEVAQRRGSLAALQVKWEEALREAAWDGVAKRVEGNAKYSVTSNGVEAALHLQPQRGLSPLGQNPETKLEEFLVIGTGVGPSRDTDGQLKFDSTSGIVLVLLPANPDGFVMGADDGNSNEQPPHTVFMNQPFFLSATEVTPAQLARLPGQADTDESALPLVENDWTDARQLCMSMLLRLPTEAEWEYACRAGTTTPWSTAGLLSMEQAKISHSKDVGDYGIGTSEVGSYRANPWGLFDMYGNVWEWCEDDWSDDYSESRRSHPHAFKEEGADYRVLRGGSFRAPARIGQWAYQDGGMPSYRLSSGFRPAKGITTF